MWPMKILPECERPACRRVCLSARVMHPIPTVLTPRYDLAQSSFLANRSLTLQFTCRSFSVSGTSLILPTVFSLLRVICRTTSRNHSFFTSSLVSSSILSHGSRLVWAAGSPCNPIAQRTFFALSTSSPFPFISRRTASPHACLPLSRARALLGCPLFSVGKQASSNFLGFARTLMPHYFHIASLSLNPAP